MNLTRKRWRLLGVACLVSLFAGTIYAWSVFSPVLAARLTAVTGTTVTPADLGMVFGLANGIAPLPMIFGGAVNDRFGPRVVVATGGILMGVGIASAGFVESVGALLLSYGLLFGIGLGLAYGTIISNTLKFFPDRRGLAGGLTTAFYGISSVVVPPVAMRLIESFGVTNAMLMAGATVGVVIVAGALASVRCPPDFVPEGMHRENAGGASSEVRHLTWREMLVDPRFVPMMVLLTCGATAGMTVISQTYSIAAVRIELGAAAASVAVSLAALANTAGRLCAGTASDYLGRPKTLALGLLLASAGLACLAMAAPGSEALFYAGLAAVGFSFGCFMGVYPGFTVQAFGSRHNSVNYGIMFAGFSVAGLLGPALVRAVEAGGLEHAYAYVAAGLVPALGFAALGFYGRAAKRVE